MYLGDLVSKTGYTGKFLVKVEDKARVTTFNLTVCKVTTVVLWVAATLAVATQVVILAFNLCSWSFQIGLE